jgi:hypothetical protein
MTSLLNFIKIYRLVQKLFGGTDRQTGDLIRLTLLFKKSRLKKKRKAELERMNLEVSGSLLNF